MAQSRVEFIGAVHTAMIDNSRYPIIAGQPMPTEMRDEMEDSMTRLANPIYTMVESFLFDPLIYELSYQVKTHLDDPIPGYLMDKIDDDTIKYNETTYQLYVDNIPLATDVKIGGVQVGAQPFIYMQGNNLMLNAETSPLLAGGNDMVPTSRAVRLYVDGAISAVSGGGGGDMYKSTYDTADSGVVDDADRLGNQLPAYYLAWSNLTGVPTTVSGYGITDVYTEAEIDAFFEGESVGKKQVDWARITNPPVIPTISSFGSNRIATAESANSITGHSDLTWDSVILTVGGNAGITGILTVDTISEYTTDAGVTINDEVYLPTITGSGTGTSIIYFNRSTGELTYGDAPSGGSMVYPDAGIALSTGSAWGTSITNNSANWNTAFGWGDHDGLYDTTGTASGLISTHESTYNHTQYDTAYTHSQLTSGNPHDVDEMVYPDAGIALSTGSAWGTSITDNSATWDAAQPGHANLTSLSGLTYTSLSFVKMSSSGTFSLDTNTYLTSETSHADVLVDGDFTSEGLMRRGASAGVYTVITDNSSDWNTAFGWGDHDGLYDTTGTASGLISTHESTYNHTQYDTAYTHSQLTTGNPHSIGYTDIPDFGTGVSANETSHATVVTSASTLTDNYVLVGSGGRGISIPDATINFGSQSITNVGGITMSGTSLYSTGTAPALGNNSNPFHSAYIDIITGVYGATSDPAGDLDLRGGDNGSTGDGGNLLLRPGDAVSGDRGSIHFGTASEGFLPSDNEETSVVAYDSTTGLLSYRSVASIVASGSNPFYVGDDTSVRATDYDATINISATGTNEMASLEIVGNTSTSGTITGRVSFHNSSSSHTDEVVAAIRVDSYIDYDAGQFLFQVGNATTTLQPGYLLNHTKHSWYTSGVERLELNTNALIPETSLTLGNSSHYWTNIYGTRYYLSANVYIEDDGNGEIQFVDTNGTTLLSDMINS